MEKLSHYFDQYILVAPGSDYGLAMWNDIGKLDCGTVLYSPINKATAFEEALYRFHFSFSINKYINLPLKNLWRNRYSLNNICFDDKKNYCIIFTDISAGRTDTNYLRELSKKNNIHLVLALVNTMKHRKEILSNRLSYFEYVFSFDIEDCKKFGFIHHPMNYSIMDIPKSNQIESDAFFVGKAVDREQIILDLFDILQKSNLNALFYIANSKRSKKNTNIHYNHWLSYNEILKHISNTNCIVEIMNGSQKGFTLRTMEAICYNKKLLTNNQEIKHSPFYNEKYIQVFDDVKDIDISFFYTNLDVDFNYNGEFSPIHLLNHIDECYREIK